MIYLENIYDIDTEIYDEVWLCVRSINAKARALTQRYNVRHVPALSPNPGLYNEYLNTERWNKQEFDSWYVPQFLNQMRSYRDAIAALEFLQQKSSSKTIAICCYCKDETLCHRSILAGILSKLGAEVYESDKYIAYGNMY